MSNYDPKLRILREMLAMSILNKLEECGFEEIEHVQLGSAYAKTAERVFARSIPNANIEVSVFTTVVGQAVRSSGKDAIRVCATYTAKDGSKKGIVKSTRIHRTGNIDDIVERMYSRMRETWKAAETGECCGQCGAPKFVSKNGNKVCAEICWLTEEEKKNNQRPYKKRRKYGKWSTI